MRRARTDVALAFIVSQERRWPSLIAALSSTACYEAKPLHLTVQTAATTLDCARTADRVFFDASYVRMSNVLGPNAVLHTPRRPAPTDDVDAQRQPRLGHRRLAHRARAPRAAPAASRWRGFRPIPAARPDLSLFRAARRRRRSGAAGHDAAAGRGVRVVSA